MGNCRGEKKLPNYIALSFNVINGKELAPGKKVNGKDTKSSV